MTKAIARIEQDIAQLEEAIASLADEFYQTYSSYLAAFGQGMKQQLILASYHLCTQGYPERFLRLSVAQKQEVQQSLQQLVKQAQAKLLSKLQTPEEFLLSVAKKQLAQENAASLAAFAIGSENEQTVEGETVSFLPGVLAQTPEENFQPDRPMVPVTEEQPIPTPEPPETTPPKLTPESLVRWQDRIEKAIAKTLIKLSRDANKLFREVDIIPNQLPEPILEATTKTASATDAVTAGPPNLLNVVIDTESPDEGENPIMGDLPMPLQIMAVHLRLVEIEFADTNLSFWRQQIRNLRGKLNHLGRDYQKKQREKAIAEAEAAWRACWYEQE
ncbi:MAG: hypothetical protein F6K32_18370 [Desertifilum sp. SIO1I2]|nr:hypothetical protein [Desertifilum sp. SIO1I2]